MKTSYTRLVILLVSSALVAAFCTGCGTVQGFGNDVENVGGNIEDAAR